MKKALVPILALLVLLVLGWVVYNNSGKKTPVSRVDLNRPLVVGVVSWPGYVGGITANKGFDANSESTFTEKYGLPVQFVLIEDIDARGKAFAKGGPDGVDVVWSTIDFWANELPNFIEGGIEAAAILHVDWSRGGDALVAKTGIKIVEDLKNKKIALVQFTPSHWLLESALRKSKLTAVDQATIRDALVFTQDVATARAAFVAGQVDAAVLWEPDVKQALDQDNSHILLSTNDFPNTIADVMVAKKDFIKAYPQAIEAFIRGWLDGTGEAKTNPDLAARLLMENEPLFEDLGFEATKDSLSWVDLTDLEGNARMFGLDGRPALFDEIFNNAGKIWQSLGVISTPTPAVQAKDDTVLKSIYSAK